MDFWLLYTLHAFILKCSNLLQTYISSNQCNELHLPCATLKNGQEANTVGHRHSRAKGKELNEHQGNVGLGNRGIALWNQGKTWRGSQSQQ